MSFPKFPLCRISAISQADLKAAEVINPEVSWARKHILSIAQRNLDLLKSGGPVAMAQYLTAATQQPKLTVSLQRSLQDLPYLTISAVYIDCSTPPQQHILTLALPKEATVAMALSRIIEPHDSGDELLHTKYLLKVCCSQVCLSPGCLTIMETSHLRICIFRSISSTQKALSSTTRTFRSVWKEVKFLDWLQFFSRTS